MPPKEKTTYTFLKDILVGLLVLIIGSIAVFLWHKYTPDIEMTSIVQSVVPYWTESKNRLAGDVDLKGGSSQLLSITISKHEARKISVDSIEIMPCFEIEHVTAVPPESTRIDNTAYFKKDSERSRSGTKCVFKGLKELPVGNVETKLFFWGKFGYESEVDVSLASPDLRNNVEAQKAVYLSGIRLFVAEYLEWFIVSATVVFFMIFLYKRAKE